MDIARAIVGKNSFNIIKYSLFVSAVLMLFLFAGCQKKSTESGTKPAGKLMNMSGCNTFDEGNTATDVPSNQDCIEYVLDEDNVLLIKHINAGFNCCPEIKTEIEVRDNVITIKEIETSGNCFCLCLYNLDYQIDNITPGAYRIIVQEHHVQDHEPQLQFTIDPQNELSGRYCVERNRYPWGQ